VCGQKVLVRFLAEGLPTPGHYVEFRHDLVGRLWLTRIFSYPKLPLQPEPFHRSRLIRCGEASALFTTFDEIQFMSSGPNRPPAAADSDLRFILTLIDNSTRNLDVSLPSNSL
jgi:hypothetical protein